MPASPGYDAAIPPGLQAPDPDDGPQLAEDEDPLEEDFDGDEEAGRREG